MISTEQLLERFNQTFDEKFLRELAMHIHDGYADAVQQNADIAPEFQRHAIPQARHYIIQTRVKKLAKARKRIAVETLYSPTGTEPYSLLQANNFMLTVSMVKSPGCLPRYSDFRFANASLNDNLFAQFETVTQERFSAILIHVPGYDNRNPEHMSVLFPNSNYTGCAHVIDLRAFIDFELEGNVPQEEIEKPLPQLRKRVSKKKGAM
jgi:hypothetical protein